MKLTAEQVHHIRNFVAESKVTIPTLKDDLIDHLCCVTELRLAKGEAFENAFRSALQELAPNGLQELQHETILLLRFNLSFSMKKLMYATGLITTIALSMGLMMKLLHMPGGEELINFGFLGFTLLFLPMITFHRFATRTALTTSEKVRMIFGFLSAVTTGLAVLFKMAMLLAPAEVLLISGASLFSFGFLPAYFYSMYKKSLNTGLA